MITIRGIEETARNLELIGDKVRKKVIRRALRAAGKPMLEEIEKRAHRAPGGPTYPDKGHFADNIQIGTSIRKTGYVQLKVGPKKGYAWANFVEYGAPRAPSRPFMRPSFSAKTQATYDAFEEELWDGIREELKLLGLS
jgi:HK97 gp10 family phage protein